MSGEEATPIVESKPFNPPHSGHSSSTDSPMSPERLIAVDDEEDCKRSGRSRPINMTNARKSPASPETDMSASYHEIFDNQMPGPLRDDDADEDDEEAANDRLGPLLSLDNNTASTTEYLTSKLVEDSLKWQRESKDGVPPSPKDSPAQKRPQQLLPMALNDDMKALSLKPSQSKKMQALDPTAIEDIERHARYLAHCVDSMVENLSGVLQSASGSTVQTLETYRDGVCKTCDEVDNNIKSMYQLMAKVEELNKSMSPAYKVSEQIKELKQLLDLYESCL